jgi:dUTP pyrophosphatase
MNIKVKFVEDPTIYPFYATAGAAGFDIAALHSHKVKPGQTIGIRTGLVFEIPEGYELQIRPRSGLTLKTDLRVNLGTIDSDYRGEVRVIVENRGETDFQIESGDRIAQGVISPIIRANFIYVEEVEDTKRGSGGFGSTGL